MSRTTQCRRNLGVLDFLLEIALVAIRTVEPPSTEFGPTHRYRSRNQLASVSHTLQLSPSRKIVQLAFNVSIQQSNVQWLQKNCRRHARFSEVSCGSSLRANHHPSSANAKHRIRTSSNATEVLTMHRPKGPKTLVYFHFYISKGPNHLKF
jgi:hypothetical protein